jgi:hypothetical protein
MDWLQKSSREKEVQRVPHRRHIKPASQTLRTADEGDTQNSVSHDCYWTVSLTLAACCMAPLVAVMVRVNVPVGVLRLVFMVRTDEPEELMVEGLKLALVRRGRPETLRPTVPVKPDPAVTVSE